MKSLHLGMILVGVVTLNAISGFKMKTTSITYEKNFQWIVENLDELPGLIESMPFSPIVYSESKWVLGLDTNPELAGKTSLDIYLRSLDTSDVGERKDITVSGEIVFGNSTNRELFRKSFSNKIVRPSMQVCLATVLAIDLIKPETARNDYFISEVFKKLDNSLVMDCSLTIKTPNTEWVDV